MRRLNAWGGAAGQGPSETRRECNCRHRDGQNTMERGRGKGGKGRGQGQGQGQGATAPRVEARRHWCEIQNPSLSPSPPLPFLRLLSIVVAPIAGKGECTCLGGCFSAERMPYTPWKGGRAGRGVEGEVSLGCAALGRRASPYTRSRCLLSVAWRGMAWRGKHWRRSQKRTVSGTRRESFVGTLFLLLASSNVGTRCGRHCASSGIG